MTTTKVPDYFASLVADDGGIPLTETALSPPRTPTPTSTCRANSPRWT